jgi:hypothetical protein
MITETAVENLLSFAALFAKEAEAEQWPTTPESTAGSVDGASESILSYVTGQLSAIEEAGEAVFTLFNEAGTVVEDISDASFVTICLPVFKARDCLSIVVLGMQASREHGAVFEWWTGYRGAQELAVKECVSWGMGRFAEMSQYFNFPIGSGIPGKVWQFGAPIALEGLGEANPFMRSSAAMSEGLHAGWGIPVINDYKLTGVFVGLTCKEVSFAKTMCAYNFNDDQHQLSLQIGQELTTDLDVIPLVLDASKTGLPSLNKFGDSSVICVPYCVGSTVRSVSLFVF